jgi:hypothetical protein
MSANDVAVTITATGLRHSIPTDVSLEDKLKFAMREVLKSNGAAFMCSNDDQQFRGAVGGVLLMCSDEERKRINVELRALQSLSAAMSGIPVDFGAVEMVEHPLGLLGMWRDTKEPTA